jgi:hypothetical protein
MRFLKGPFLNSGHLSDCYLNRMLLLTVLLLSIRAEAIESYVFCYDADNDSWEWLDDHVRVQGDYWRHDLIDQNEYFYYMNISIHQYAQLKALCPMGHYPQPAEHRLSRWSVFRVVNGQQSQFAKGKRSYYRLVDHVFLRFSDLHLKSKIEPLHAVLPRVTQVQGYRYHFQQYPRPEFGFIAQELEKIFPELVLTDSPGGYKKVDYRGLIPVLLESIKELNARVKHLEANTK